MDFNQLCRVLWDRWRVSVPGLLLTAAIAVAAWIGVPATYQSNATISLIGSKALAAEPGGGRNPYVVTGDLGPMANILVSDLSSQQSAQQLKSLGVSTPFTAAVPTDATGQLGPFVTLTASGRSAADLRAAMPVIIGFSQQLLRRLQQETTTAIPSNALITAVVIADPSTPAPVLKSRVEVEAGIVIAGLAATLLLSFGAEARSRRRRISDRASANASAARSYPNDDRPARSYPNDDRLQRETRRSEDTRWQAATSDRMWTH